MIKRKIKTAVTKQHIGAFDSNVKSNDIEQLKVKFKVLHVDNLTYDKPVSVNSNARDLGSVPQSVLGTETQHTVAFPRNDYENVKGLKAISSNDPFLQKNPQPWRNAERPTTPANNSDSVLNAYLERQGRNEFINLASQTGFDGTNIAFVFYENQVRRLMDESPYDERRLEVLGVSCVGQPSEMANLFCAPMKNMSTAQRIEKALDRLRQRYGVSGGLTSEPKIIAICHGAKIAFNSTSLKSFNDDLNTLEVYAYAHDEYHKISGQLLIDTANRLPNTLKRRYIDFVYIKMV